MSMEVVTARINAARAELSDYGFDEGLEPVEVNGWAFEKNQDNVICALFFPQLENSKGGHTVLGQFTVEFAPGSAEVVNAYATANGEDVGYRRDQSSGNGFRH